MFGSEKVVTKSRRQIGCNRYCFLNASATEDRQLFGRGFNYQSQKLPNGCVPQPLAPVTITFPSSPAFFALASLNGLLRCNSFRLGSPRNVPRISSGWVQGCELRPSAGFLLLLIAFQKHLLRAQWTVSPTAQYFFNKASFPTRAQSRWRGDCRHERRWNLSGDPGVCDA